MFYFQVKYSTSHIEESVTTLEGKTPVDLSFIAIVFCRIATVFSFNVVLVIGSFKIRFKNPDLHRQAAVYAYNHNVSLNSVVEESVAEYLMSKHD